MSNATFALNDMIHLKLHRSGYYAWDTAVSYFWNPLELPIIFYVV